MLSVRKLKRYLSGGSPANDQLTALTGATLLIVLAIEGVTLLQINALLTVHAFVGMLLIPIGALKLASAGWRAIRYYRGAGDYVLRGPPQAALRFVVAPIVVLSTAVLFATGVALLALDRTQGMLVALHKASFIVWLPATGLHVLAHLAKLPRRLLRRLPHLGLRLAVVGATVATGLAVAVAALPAADHLQDAASAPIGLDAN
jgi:hypothetical protein